MLPHFVMLQPFSDLSKAAEVDSSMSFYSQGPSQDFHRVATKPRLCYLGCVLVVVVVVFLEEECHGPGTSTECFTVFLLFDVIVNGKWPVLI